MKFQRFNSDQGWQFNFWKLQINYSGGRSYNRTAQARNTRIKFRVGMLPVHLIVFFNGKHCFRIPLPR